MEIQKKFLLTASNFGKPARTKVEPSSKLKSILFSDFATKAIFCGRENEKNAVKIVLEQSTRT